MVCMPQGMWDRGRNGKKEKKKTQLVLVEQVSRAVAGVGDKSNLAGMLTKNGRGEDAVMANRPCFVCWKGSYVWQKNRKGSGRKGSGTGTVVKGFENEQVPWWGQVVHFHTP